MVPFYTRFRELAFREMRSATVSKWPGLPPGTYGFLELYCDEAGCDCRRAIIQVISPDSGRKVWATINYGWESAEFYRRWISDPVDAERCAGAWLDPLNRQSRHAPALLEVFRDVLKDSAYVERLKRHYGLFKAAIAEPPFRSER